MTKLSATPPSFNSEYIAFVQRSLAETCTNLEMFTCSTAETIELTGLVVRSCAELASLPNVNQMMSGPVVKLSDGRIATANTLACEIQYTSPEEFVTAFKNNVAQALNDWAIFVPYMVSIAPGVRNEFAVKVRIRGYFGNSVEQQ